MGILLSVFALQEVEILSQLANFLETNLANNNTMIIALGFLSSLVNNGSYTRYVFIKGISHG